MLLHSSKLWLLWVILALAGQACQMQTYPTQPPPNKSEAKPNSTQDNRRMTCQHHSLSLKDSLRIVLQIYVPRLEKSTNTQEFISSFSILYGILPDYNSQNFLSTKNVNLSQAILQKKGSYFYLTLDVAKKPDVSEVMLVEISDNSNNKRLVHDLPLQYLAAKFRDNYGLFEAEGKLPLFTHHLTLKDTAQVRSWQKNTERQLWVRYYKAQFANAATPMAVAQQGLLPKNIPHDSLYPINSHQPITFKKAGLYAVVEDTLAFYSLTLWVDANEKYPKYSHPSELIQPLIYISLDEEMKKLSSSQTSIQALKQELDRYWLKLMQGNTRKAKMIIKEFYNRVRLANQYFTSFKEGWKTDMGMIFIVFGVPNRITKTKDKQLWTYTQNPNFSEINFTFVQKINQFTDNYYTLIRYPEYEQIWYPTVELWREGKLSLGITPK